MKLDELVVGLVESVGKGDALFQFGPCFLHYFLYTRPTTLFACARSLACALIVYLNGPVADISERS